MHLHTTVRVRADSEDDAVRKVAQLLADEFENGTSFDWYDEDATRISAEVKTEEGFAALRSDEFRAYLKYMTESTLVQGSDEDRRGYLLAMAGECLWSSNFDSTERLAYDMDWEEGANVYFVETDRHC